MDLELHVLLQSTMQCSKHNASMGFIWVFFTHRFLYSLYVSKHPCQLTYLRVLRDQSVVCISRVYENDFAQHNAPKNVSSK